MLSRCRHLRSKLGAVSLVLILLRFSMLSADDAGQKPFEQAASASLRGQHEEALHGFESAWALSHKPRILLYIARSLQHLQRDQEALVACQRFLQAVPTPTAAELAIVREI